MHPKSLGCQVADNKHTDWYTTIPHLILIRFIFHDNRDLQQILICFQESWHWTVQQFCSSWGHHGSTGTADSKWWILVPARKPAAGNIARLNPFISARLACQVPSTDYMGEGAPDIYCMCMCMLVLAALYFGNKLPASLGPKPKPTPARITSSITWYWKWSALGLVWVWGRD